MDVNNRGAATYVIPIAAPPGTAGLIPSVSLQYNSQHGNGLVGMGWSLGDLPAIKRCPRTVAQDGVRSGIDYDGNDRFCLEGQRLVAVSGAYGADGTEYRTELESFSRIISYGASGAGPSWFKVWTKGGRIMEFGKTDDSRIQAQGRQSVRVWAVNKVEDTKGNYFTVSYGQWPEFGNFRPSRIDYTGNSLAGLTPYASVRFVWELRSDQPTHYHAGSMTRTRQRLTNVQSYVGSNLVLDYRLAYDASPATHRSRLTSITLCAADESCLPAATFSYENGNFASTGNLAFTAALNEIDPSSIEGGTSVTLGDWNGDGIADLLWWNKADGTNRWFVSNGARTGTLAFAAYTNLIAPSNLVGIAGNLGTTALYVGDWNGDGVSDILWYESLTRRNRWFVSNGAAGGSLTFTAYLDPVDPALINAFAELHVGDWNGDGMSDVMTRHPDSGDNRWFISKGVTGGALDFTYRSNAILQSRLAGSSVEVHVGDWNGDGISDLVWYDPGLSRGNRWFISDGAADGTLNFSTQLDPIDPATIADSSTLHIGDWNGDGLSDAMFWHKDTGDNVWFINKGPFTGTGLSFVRYVNPIASIQGGSGIRFGDWNGDGIPDLLWWNAGGGNRWYVSNGVSGGILSFTGYLNPISTDSFANGTAFVGDWNGDGITDVMRYRQETGGNNWFISKAKLPDMLASVDNGLGETTTVAYAPLSQGAPFYYKDSSATYPVVDFEGPLYAVRQVDASNGIGGINRWVYRYGGARFDLARQIPLGFRAIIVRDEQTTIERRTQPRQDWPFVGMVATHISMLGDVELSRIHNSYDATSLGGIRRYVKLTQSVASGKDLDGTPLPTTTTTYEYDGYGNPTEVVAVTNDGYTRRTVSTYSNDTVNWLLGKLRQTTVTSETPN